MDPVLRKPEAGRDIGQLTPGATRLDIALGALQEPLTPAQVARLEAELNTIKSQLSVSSSPTALTAPRGEGPLVSASYASNEATHTSPEPQVSPALAFFTGCVGLIYNGNYALVRDFLERKGQLAIYNRKSGNRFEGVRTSS
jgi:hypothetical protein